MIDGLGKIEADSGLRILDRGTGKFLYGTVLREGGFRVAGPRDRKISRQTGFGPGSFAANGSAGKWLSGRWNIGSQTSEVEEPRTGKVVMSNGLEVRGLSGLRTKGLGNVDTERSGAGKVRFGTVLCDGGFRVV